MENNNFSLLFLGTGSGGHLAMGSASACLEINQIPALLIDCGPGTLSAFQQRYNRLPEALFISHCHMDHIADLEILTVRAKLQGQPPIPIYVPLTILPTLHQRLATYPGSMAEGNHNFWSSFQLIPVVDEFYHQGHRYRCYPTRHHAPNSSFALHLPGIFFYTGDTRPIPEILSHCCGAEEVIFHDCGTHSNPSHTGLDDLSREYPTNLTKRFVLYHYADEQSATTLEDAGYRVARPGISFCLTNSAL